MNALIYYALVFGAIFWGTVLLLFILGSKSPAAAYWSRFLVAWSVLSTCAIYGTIASAILTVVGYQGLSQWTTARAFKWGLALAMGIKFVLHDEHDYLNTTRPAVFIGNHQTELDIGVLGVIFPKYCVVTSKRSLQWVPFLGWFMTLSGTVFIDRTNAKSARSAFDSAANRIRKERISVFIFPEGTRSRSAKPELLSFKKGAFHLAVQAGVPIVPVVTANYSYVLHGKSNTFTSGQIPIKVLKPIETKNLKAEDVEELTNSTRELMHDELLKLSSAALAEYGPHPASQAVNGDKARSTGIDKGQARAR